MTALTPQGISRLLKQCGFTRSALLNSYVGGVREHCAGYVVTAGAGCVRVLYRHHSYSAMSAERQRDHALLDLSLYAECLRAHFDAIGSDWLVILDEDDWHHGIEIRSAAR